MRAWCSSLLLVLLSGPATAQQGLDAAVFPLAPGADDYFTARRAGLRGHAVTLAVSWAWQAWQDGLGPGSGWQVSERLGLQLGARIAVAGDWHLVGWSSGLPYQQGRRLDAAGEPVELAAGWGETWLALEHTLWRRQSFSAGLLGGLRLPTAGGSSLGGDPDWGMQLALLARANWAYLELAADAGLVTRRRAHYQRFVWDDAWHVALAAAGGAAGWPLHPVLELRGSGLWTVEADTGPAHWWQVCAGARLELGPWRVLLGGARGLYGVPLARWRLLLRLGLVAEKNAREEE